MTIAEAREKCKSLSGRIPHDVLILAILVLSASASFGLGYLAGRDAGQGGGADPSMVVSPAVGEYVASKGGTKYYLPSCAGAARLSEENKIWFASAEAAIAAGYTPASNCPGL